MPDDLVLKIGRTEQLVEQAAEPVALVPVAVEEQGPALAN
jgi:hypothetical protein